MSRVITFSRFFPAYHPKKGEPTYFVEKITRSLHLQGNRPWNITDEIFSEEIYYLCDGKHHTIRAGNRWKVGDKFSPRVWSGKPYQSKQITIAPDIEIKKVWDFEIYSKERGGYWTFKKYIDGDTIFLNEEMKALANNDGLALQDMIDWFKIHPKKNNEGFKGQIICWNENIEY